ncbi:hypothetical protein [Microbacterium sp. A93]|uniref:hypothetical protein n=1 Tax=Microbacterium sp. A93 TaxID=3450716 RepID=UPI003F41CD51
MLIGLMRPVETTSVDVEAADLAAVQTQLALQKPQGFDLISAPVKMIKGASTLKATGTFARRDQIQQIDADDMDALLAKVPEGWQLLNVRDAS